jgi:hypothetical protein
VVLQLSGVLRVRLATAILVAVMLWPFAQHAIVRHFEMDPWAFFGFAMYSVPNLRVNVRAARLEAADPGAAPDWNAISIGSYAALTEFAVRRARWGRWLPPDRVAQELFAAQPDLPGLMIRVRRWELSRESARLEPRDSDYFYQPPGLPLAATTSSSR